MQQRHAGPACGERLLTGQLLYIRAQDLRAAITQVRCWHPCSLAQV